MYKKKHEQKIKMETIYATPTHEAIVLLYQTKDKNRAEEMNRNEMNETSKQTKNIMVLFNHISQHLNRIA